MGAKHPLLLIPDAFVLGAYTFITGDYVHFATAVYATIGALVGLKQLLARK